MNRKRKAWAALGLAVGILLSGCTQNKTAEWNGNENSIYVTRDMEVESALVYSSDQSNELYKQEELTAFVEQAVMAYNEEQGAEAAASNDGKPQKLPVALKSCRLEGSTGTLVFEYGEPGHYVPFGEMTGDNTNTVTALTVRKVSQEVEAGGLADAKSFTKANGKEASLQDVMQQSDQVVVSVEGAATIYTEGKITFVSGQPGAVTLRDGFTAVTGEGKHYIIFK